MSDGITRRETLAAIAAMALAGPLELAEAQHVHQATAADAKAAGGLYAPKALTRHEFDSLRALCDVIVPGASKGNAAEFIDLLASQNPEMAAIYTGGLAWLDEAMKRAYSADFLTARAEDRTAMLDKLATRSNNNPDLASSGLAAGVRFFYWTRRMAVDAYYTSAAGIKELGYIGNKGMTEFKVPQNALDYALKRS
jgi:gluconate 2-dehydrogenase gamma chain